MNHNWGKGRGGGVGTYQLKKKKTTKNPQLSHWPLNIQYFSYKKLTLNHNGCSNAIFIDGGCKIIKLK